MFARDQKHGFAFAYMPCCKIDENPFGGNIASSTLVASSILRQLLENVKPLLELRPMQLKLDKLPHPQEPNS